MLRYNKKILVLIIIFVLPVLVYSKTWKIMPVGNSITAGEGSSSGNGYRQILFNNLSNSGYDIEFVGPYGAPYNGFYQAGAKIEQFLPGGDLNITTQLNTYFPDIVLVQLGTNNTGHDAYGPYTDANSMSGKMYKLLQTISQHQNVRYILFCKIIPKIANGNEEPKIRQYNAELEKFFFDNPPSDNLTIVDMYSAVSVSQLVDGVHPNNSGYQNMAIRFELAISDLIDEDVSDDSPPSRISWKQAYSINSQSARLEWIAPSDDGASRSANIYELRYATFNLDASNFKQGKLVSVGKPGSPGSVQKTDVTNLLPDQSYFFAIRAWDASGNIGPLSESILVETSVAGIEYCTNFGDPELSEWSSSPNYEVVDSNLVNSNPLPGWTDLAVYTSTAYSPNASTVEASFTWSDLVDDEGINSSGIAMLLNNSNYSEADGYLVRVRNRKLYLEIILNGEAQAGVLDEDSFYKDSPSPSQGDELKIQFSYDISLGNIFNAYINGTWVGQVNDPNISQGNAQRLYSGVMLYGARNNDISSFCVAVPPLGAYTMDIHTGDNEVGKVDDKLAIPLSVQVTDVNGQGVSNIPVQFDVISGTAFLSTDSIGDVFDGNIWYEAESGIIEPPMSKSSSSTASNGKYILAPNVSNAWGRGKAYYRIFIPKTDGYALWMRVAAQSSIANSVFLAIGDTTRAVQWNFKETGDWKWYRYPSSWVFEAGFLDFAIKNREPNTWFDKILFTSNSGYTPTGTGGSNQEFSNITNVSGFATTEVTFGTQAETVEIEAYAPLVPNNNRQIFTLTVNAGDPNQMARTSASTMTGKAGELLSEPFSITLTDKYANKCSGVKVRFTVQKGDGSFNNRKQIDVYSDQTGNAQALLKLGYEQETIVQVSLPNFPNIPSLEFRGVAGEGVPVAITELGGNNQTARVMTTLPESLSVRITDENGDPVENFPVPFELISGNGSIEGEYPVHVDTTNAEGIASVVTTLGDTAGTHIHQVQVNPNVPLDNAPLVFKATALPDDPFQIIKESGENQSIGAGHTFESPLVARVVDQYKNGISDYKLVFNVANGDGNFEQKVGTSTTAADTTIETDETGRVELLYTAGTITGNHQIRVDGEPPVQQGYRIFNLNVTEPIPHRMVKMSGDAPLQAETVGSLLAKPFNVKVLNAFGQPIGSGIDVVFKSDIGNGKFYSSDSVIKTTDANGIASALFTLGTVSGIQTAIVYVKEYENVQPLEFRARANPAAPYRITADSPVGFEAKAGEGPIQLRIQVLDQFENPKPGQMVTFNIVQGGGHFSNNSTVRSVVSDSISGSAMVEFFMGKSTATRNIIHAVAVKGDNQSLKGSPIEFRGTVKPEAPDLLVKKHGDEPVQSVPVMTIVPDSFTVSVQDKYNNPVPNTEVLFTVKSSNGSLEGMSQITKITNSNGLAWTWLKVGSHAGEYSDTVKVSVPNLPDIPSVEFIATARSGLPTRIFAVGDSSWQEPIGETNKIFQPQIRLVDTYNNPVPNHSVEFKILQGTSSIDNGQTAVKQTDDQGTAGVIWRLNNTPSQHILQASAKLNNIPVNNSPVQFTVTTITGEPKYISLINTPGDTSTAGQSTPITVRVTDIAQNPIPNHPVHLSVTHYNSEDQHAVFVVDGKLYHEVTINTNTNGYAHASFIPILEDNQIKIRAYDTNNAPLDPSPINLFVWGIPTQAKRMEVLSDKHHTVVAGQPLTVRAAAFDAVVDGNRIDGHRIQFSILKGDGYLLSSNYSYSTKKTMQGEARETWFVGHNTEEINAIELNGGAIPGSPDTVYVNIKPTSPFSDSCSISYSGQIVSDGSSSAQVHVALVDTFGNPIPGETVELVSDSESAQFVQPEPTDSQGQALGIVRSTLAESLYVTAIVSNYPTLKLDTVAIPVKPGQASKLSIVNQSHQFTGNKGAVLKDSLAVIAKDKNDNLVPYTNIKFDIKAGNGYFTENRQKMYYEMTDSSGIAAVHLVIGPEEDENYLIYASIDHPDYEDVQVAFLGKSRSAVPPFSLSKISGDSLTASVGQELPSPIRVKVVDSDGIPVRNTPVSFTPLGDSDLLLLEDNPALTDHYGHADMRLRFNKISGAHQIEARLVGNTDNAIFIAFARAGSASKLLAANSAKQSATVGKTYNDVVIVQSQDDNGNPVGGVKIEFSLIGEPAQEQQAAVLEPSTVTTDEQGLAAATIQMGIQTGEYIFEATSPDMPEERVQFQVLGTSDKAFYLEKYSGDEQSMTKGRQLVYPIVVKITDQYHNPVAGETVYFAPETESGYTARQTAESNSEGLASTRWTIGYLDVNTLLATKVGLQPNFVRYHATGVDNNFPEFVDLPDTITVNYGEPVTVQLEAEDKDNDPLTCSVLNPPVNSEFDPDTNRFTWTPRVDQKGTWTIKFRVEDDKTGYLKGFDLDSVIINVVSQIKIYSYYPTDLSEIRKPEIIEFSVQVMDQGIHQLSYKWSVDGIPEPVNTNRFSFYSTKYSRGDHVIKVVVTDGISSDSLVWNTVVTKVELSTFEAQAVPFEGVRLYWETSNEVNNAGFNVLRSNSENGPYQKLNSRLMLSNTKGEYAFLDTTATGGHTFYYKLEDLSLNGYSNQSEAIRVKLDLPGAFKVLQNYPNPFNPETTIRFQLPAKSDIRISIFNIRGQLVKALINERMAPGYYEISWDGTNNQDLRVASGVYYYRFHTKEYQSIKKMVLLK